MNITRSQLKRTLDFLRMLDGASPYFGLQWTDKGVAVFRSSNLGQVYSGNWDESKHPVVVSVSHLATSLDALRADEFEILRGPNDSLYLKALGEFSAEVRIHTVRESTVWRKRHVGGAVLKDYDLKLFAGIDPRPFSLQMEPVVKAGKMLLTTGSGIIMRHGLGASVFPYPRAAFLKAITGREIERLFLTAEGYWGAVMDGHQLIVAGHRVGDPLFNKYDRPIAPLSEIAAPSFMAALSSAVRWADKSARVTFDTRRGIIATEDAQHNSGEFSFGSPDNWTPFALDYGMAKLLGDVFVQTTDERIHLIENQGNTLRLLRGPWEVVLHVFR